MNHVMTIHHRGKAQKGTNAPKGKAQKGTNAPKGKAPKEVETPEPPKEEADTAE